MVQDMLKAVDPNLRGFFPRTLTEHVNVSMLPVRLAAGLATVVGALALGLAIVGFTPSSRFSLPSARTRSDCGWRWERTLVTCYVSCSAMV